MPTQIGPDEKLLILDDAESGTLTIPQIAIKYGRHEHSIRRLIHKFHPSTVLATKYLRANALRLAQKVVKHSTVSEAIDVLSRPNIDVLKPQAKEQSITGFFTSVSLDSCGAVKEVKGAVIHAIGQGSSLSNEGQRPLSLQGKEGSGSQENVSPQVIDVAPRRRNAQRNAAPDEEESLIVDQPELPAPKKRKKVHANPAKQVTESNPSRKAILKLARGHNTHDKDSSIHLRYDLC